MNIGMKKAKEKASKIWVHAKYISSSKQSLCLAESMLASRRNAGTKHCPSQAPESHNSSSFPCQPYRVHASGRYEHGKVDLA